MARKMDAKAFAQQKRKRRQWLTFVRMCRYGVNNFSRNAWLTIAATAVMTVTLLVVFLTLASRQVLVDTVDQIKDKVNMSIYVVNTTTDEQAAKIQKDLEGLSSVKSVTYISPTSARKQFAETNKADNASLDALNEATNKFPGTFRVGVRDINNTSQLSDFVAHNTNYKKHVDPNHEPSFAGDKKTIIENIGRWVSFAEKIGIGASVVFIVISSLIVFNTIRMAIFNRKEEIQMMKLIGADRSFIRGPFVVEAVVYGFIAALLSTSIGITILYLSRDKLISYEVAVQPTMNLVTIYGAFVLLGMIAIGATIGVVSSLLATRKYLKI